MTVELGVILAKAAFAVYVLATVIYLWHMVSSKDSIGKAGTGLLALGLVIHTASLVVRTVAAERPPFLNLYEYLLSAAWGGVALYLVIELITRKRMFGAFVVPLITAVTFLTIRLPSEVNPTMPALESSWRVPHIATAILAYASFAIAFGIAFMLLIAEKTSGSKKSFWTSRLPDPKMLDQTIYRIIVFGWMMQTLLLITGAIWAQFVFGRYWSWDPKETWALVTWLIYAAFLHIRLTKGWKGRKAAIMAIIGFGAVIFTLIGVNWLGGYHSYGKLNM